MLVASPFGKSPQLAAIAATFLAILLAIVALVLKGGATLAVIYTLVFPPGFFVFAILSLCAYEEQGLTPQISQPDPYHGTRVAALFIVALIDIIIFPLFALMVENARYNAKNPGTGLFSKFKRRPDVPLHPEGAAIAVRNLKKTFPGGTLLKRQRVTAIEDLSFTVPKTGIWILLGGFCKTINGVG